MSRTGATGRVIIRRVSGASAGPQSHQLVRESKRLSLLSPRVDVSQYITGRARLSFTGGLSG